jgi:hypothetical protein
VKIESDDGCFADLAILSYQFPERRPTGERDWDANWLVLRGNVWDGSQSWSFEDPCMTTWEAQDLVVWLRALDQPRTPSGSGYESGSSRMHWLTEPNVSFGLDDYAHGVTSLSAYFNLESRPRSGSNDDGEGLGHRVRLRLPQAFIARAASEWEQELQAFPER